MAPSPPPIPTSIGRPLDPSYPTNRAVLALVPLAALAGAVWAPVGAVAGAIAVGGGSFVAWALARELAPDDDPAAFAALATAGAVALSRPEVALLPLFALLVLTRVVNRTVGPPARLLDTAAATALAAWAAWRPGGWPIAWAAAAALGLDRRLDPVGPKAHGGLALAFALYGALRLPDALPPDLPPPVWTLALGAAVLLFGVAILRTRALRSTADVTGEPLRPARVRAGMTVALLAAAPGLAGVGLRPLALSPLWAALAAVGILGLRRRARSRG